MNLLNLFDILDTVSAEKSAETPAGIPAAVQVSQADGQPATIVVPVSTTDEVEVLEDGHEDSLDLGDEVIITGNVQFKGKTGRVVDFGANKHFVVVDLYNFGKHSFHSSNVEANDYADSEEEENNWQEREDYGTFGDDERDEDLNEGFGAYYYEQLAQKVFDERPNFSTKGRADELLDYAYRFAVQDLGKSRARYEFMYDEDFPSDFVSAYAELQRGTQGVAEDLGTMAGAAALGSLAAGAIGAGMGTWLKKDREKEKAKMAKITDPKKHKESCACEKCRGSSDTRLKQGVAEGEYDDPRWEPREPDMSRKVDWDIEAQRNQPEEPEAAKTVTVTDNDGNVVLTFPSTGGFYGDLRHAASKGFDTDSGDYHLSWKRDTNEGNNWLDTPVSEEFDRIKKLAGLK